MSLVLYFKVCGAVSLVAVSASEKPARSYFIFHDLYTNYNYFTNNLIKTNKHLYLQEEIIIMNIEIIAGSPRNPSLNARVAKYLFKHLQDTTSHHIGLIEMNKTVLPFIQNVWTSAERAPEEFRPLAERMFAADAFIICSPEYNGAYSPAMKNLFDHFPKQNKKVFGIATSSNGVMGGIRASQQLLQLVPALFGIASPYLLIVPQADKKFDEEGQLIAPEFQKNIEDFAREFIWLAEQVKGKS